MTRSRLLILSFSNIASDARVLKQVEYFADRYDVTTCGFGPQPHPGVTHLELDPVHQIRQWTRFDIAARRFGKIYWNQPAIKAAAIVLEPASAFDVILANDVDAVGLAVNLHPLNGVHADIHEFAPRQDEDLLMWRLFVAPYVRWMCRAFLPLTASMTTVGQGIADEYLKEYGLRAQVVSNAAPYAELEPTPPGSTIRLVHSGASLRNRRLETLVDAVLASTSDITLDLYLMANDPAHVDELRARAGESGRVNFPDPVPYKELIAQLNGYDLGVHVIAPTNFNNRWALPNKFFDYVQARLGLIIGPSPEMQLLLEKHKLGAVAEDFDAPALTAVLDSLTVEQVREWKANAQTAAHDLSSESQVVVWGAAIEALAKGSPS